MRLMSYQRCFAVVLLLPTLLLAQTSNPIVRLETSMGDIYLELFPEDAPVSVENFLSYVNRDFYNGLVFHRVIDGFVIQTGAFDENLNNLHSYDPSNPDDPNYPIINESSNGLKNLRGTLAMARTSDPNSATSQFYINLVDNSSLDYVAGGNVGYAVFGQVITGMAVVDVIGTVPTSTQGGMDDVPVTPVFLEDATELTSDNVTVERLQVMAGPYRGQDSFILRTSQELTLADWQEADDLTLHLDDFTQTLDLANFRALGASGLYLYQHAAPGITLVLANLNAGTLLIMGQQTDLTGLREPVETRIIVGDYFARGEADRDVVNNGAGAPIVLLQGVEDALRVDHFVHINSADTYYYMVISGSIATERDPAEVDLTDLDSYDPMAVTWKTYTSNLTAFYRVGAGNYFRHDWSNQVAWAWFNLDTGRFFIFSDNAGAVSTSMTLTISFDLDDYSFEQTATIR
ncbi:MAG: peptidylprolyl isomerase [Sedimentisphaerales bacterium]|nr:peptidylprolyl isomerase [Sedimentisphaerales bacterium]